MLKFRAKIDTSVNKVVTRRIASAPKIAITPTAIGNAAANNPPNTQTNTMKLRGIAIDSISSRSCCDCSVTCTFTMATPPERTVTPSRSCATWSDKVFAYVCALLSPPVMPATISPDLRSRLTSSVVAGGGAVHAEVTLATWGDWRN